MPKSRSRPLAIALVLLALPVLIFGFSTWQKIRLDESSSNSAISITQQLYSSGSSANLVNSLHADLAQQMTAEQWQATVNSQLQRLGPMTAMTEMRGEAAVPMVTYPGQRVAANYEIDIEFGETPTTLYVEMLWDGSDWRITEYRLDAPVLYD